MSSLNRDSTNSGCSETCLRLSVTMHRDTTRLKYFRTTIQFRIAHKLMAVCSPISRRLRHRNEVIYPTKWDYMEESAFFDAVFFIRSAMPLRFSSVSVTPGINGTRGNTSRSVVKANA